MLIKKENITAIILAGGRGSRMGGLDKGLVTYQKKKLIEHVLDAISPQVGQIIINANRNQPEYQSYGYPVINDELSDFQGPLAGFYSAMNKSATDYIVTLPCDGPNLPNDLVERLSQQVKNEHTIAVAYDGRRMQPVYALIPVSLKNSLYEFLESGDRKIDLWYAQHNTQLVDFSDKDDAFFNINTEEQRQQGKMDG